MQLSSQTLVTVALTEQEVVQILAGRTGISGWSIEVWDVDAPDAVGGSDMEWEARLTLHEYTDPDAVPDDLVARTTVPLRPRSAISSGTPPRLCPQRRWTRSASA